MILFLRSLLFNILFFSWTILMSLMGFQFLFTDRRPIHRAARRWGAGTNFLLKHIVHIDVEFRGREHLVGGPHLLASKHQSLWETAMVETLVPDCTIVFKRELAWVPLFGQLMVASDMIAIHRKSGKKILSQMVDEARKRFAQGRSVWIFPEGTRQHPDAKPAYKYGIYALYHALNVPVIPIALNSGYCWGRQGFIKRPGKIILEVLPPIAPGLDARPFLETLENVIETKCRDLALHAAPVSIPAS